MLKIFLASATLLASASYAIAADPMSSEPAVQPIIFSWSGAFVGVQAGYVWADATTFDEFEAFIPFDPDGLSAGVYAGYNHQFGNGVVVGIDTDFSYTDADGSSIAFTAESNPISITTGTATIEWTGAVRARLGYAAGRFLPYIAGGAAFARVEDTIDIEGNIGTSSDIYSGYTVGAGLEYALTDNIIIRSEYRFSDYGDRAFTDPISNTVELQIKEVQIGVSYKF